MSVKSKSLHEPSVGFIHIHTVSILQNHLRSRGRSSICEHKMVSVWGEQQHNPHVKGIYGFLWGVTGKAPVWAAPELCRAGLCASPAALGSGAARSFARPLPTAACWKPESRFSACFTLVNGTKSIKARVRTERRELGLRDQAKFVHRSALFLTLSMN